MSSLVHWGAVRLYISLAASVELCSRPRQRRFRTRLLVRRQAARLGSSDDPPSSDLARRRLHRLSGHGGQVKAVAFSNDGKQVVTGAGDGILRLWSAVDGRRTAEMTEHKRRADREDKPLSAGVTTVAASPTGADRLGRYEGTVLLWDGRTGAFLRTGS